MSRKIYSSRQHWVGFNLLIGVAIVGVLSADGQVTKLKLSSIAPGTEKVQLVYNGDFQITGSPGTNGFPNPPGWIRLADIQTGSGTNLVTADECLVAYALVSSAAAVCKYQRQVRLLPATDYILSGYVWNMGDANNHVSANLDLNDVPQDPQISVSWSDTKAYEGYFVYRSFNTTNSGTNVTLRVFYDSFAGTGTASNSYPLAAQWDNIAITRASDFVPPQSAGSGANMRPAVRITDPLDLAVVTAEGVPPILPVAVAGADFDGTISKIELYAGGNKIGQANGPSMIQSTNPAPGTREITAVATDNQGASTTSAPVSLCVYVAPQPVPLRAATGSGNMAVSWPASASASGLQSTANLNSKWMRVTNEAAIAGGTCTTAITRSTGPQFFRLGPEVDTSTLNGKLLMGYQGWFGCTNDASQGNRWIHWFRSNNSAPTNSTVDLWPDISELDSDELFDTGMTLSNGSPARVYSAYNPKTVVRHFQWMKEHHLDGVFLQRFSSTLSDAASVEFRNRVTMNVRAGASQYGRAFAIMYDISGQNPATLVSTLTNDWASLVNDLHITNSPFYLRHNGKPVLAVWGFGFNDRPGTPDDAQAVIAFFKAAGCTVMGGVPTYWRTLKNDSQTNAAWAAAYRAFDIVSPWAVGRFTNNAGADSFKTNQIIPDLAECSSLEIDYMPVIFPGFSWHNLKGDPSPLNQIPRAGGQFYWRQVFNAIDAGCSMIYGAMFDEMDEGTAMLKLAPTRKELPVETQFVSLDADGSNLPSDWYLQLADQAGRMLRREIPLQSQIPISP